MNKTLSLLLLSAISMTCAAESKLDLQLNHRLHRQQAVATRALADAAPMMVIATLRNDVSVPVAAMQQAGIEVVRHYGRLYALRLTADQLPALSEMSEWSHIASNRSYRMDNAASRQAMQVDDVQDTLSVHQVGLDHTYTGRGVMVGVYDTGIDFNHINFLDTETGETRIRQACLYTGMDIDAEAAEPIVATDPASIARLTTDNTRHSHGTHTTSTAAGSYCGEYLNTRGEVTYSGIQGIASRSDLVLCGDSLLDELNILHAFQQMDSVAAWYDEPIVVNFSIGDTGDWMDGKTPLNEAFSEFTGDGNRPGRIICVSAGNDGGTPFTIRGQLDETNGHRVSSFFPSYDANKETGEDYYSPWIAVYGDDATPFLLQVDFYNKKDFTPAGGYSAQELLDNGWLTCDTYQQHDGRYAALLDLDGDAWTLRDVYCAITVVSEEDCGFRMLAKSWSASSGYYRNCKLESKMRPGFTAGDASSSLNVLSCTDAVLSVGAWIAADSFVNYAGKSYTQKWGDAVGASGLFSSYVTADDHGIARPDFAAPGTCVISGYNIYDLDSYDDGQYALSVCGIAVDSLAGRHRSLCGMMSGTSMASPNATGIVAIWLEKNPELTVRQIREIVRQTADQDSYTEADPSRFGAGKINALQGLLAIASPESGLATVPASVTAPYKKCLCDGRLVIERQGDRYDALGRRL